MPRIPFPYVVSVVEWTTDMTTLDPPREKEGSKQPSQRPDSGLPLSHCTVTASAIEFWSNGC